jgi:hypothetical protein
MVDRPWSVREPAIKASQKLDELGKSGLPGEVLRIDEDVASIVCEIDGVDYILTMMRMPNQRPRPN